METITSEDKTSSNNYIAFFDLDLTIISANSGKILIKESYKRKLMTRIDLLRGIWLSLLYKYHLRETVKIINSMTGWLKGINENEFEGFSKDIFDNHIRNTIRPEIIQQINKHKSRGAKTVILSSALIAICKPVAEFLGMDDVICTSLEVQDGVLTGKPSGAFCFGKEKVTRLLDYCKTRNIDPHDSWYYGDSIADLPVLSSVGNPVCVAPDKKLLKHAIKNGWKVLPKDF